MKVGDLVLVVSDPWDTASDEHPVGIIVSRMPPPFPERYPVRWLVLVGRDLEWLEADDLDVFAGHAKE